MGASDKLVAPAGAPPINAVSGWDRAVSPSEPSHFRPDIEGLRAVAILAVLAFHAGIAQAPGGFVGVDVFFVISGFLITGLLLREFGAAGRIDLPSFYARRARRLLPAALVVIAATVAVSAVVLPSVDVPDVAADGAAAALYVSNYRFALTATDYFAADTLHSPLLHYWSLAVEEQFYLFWPLLLLLGARYLGVRRLWWLVALIGLLSFALSVVVTGIEQPWAFYSLPTRAWQLALGGLIALEVIRLPASLPRGAATLLGAAGLVLVGLAVVLIDGSVAFPGFAALLPAAGAGLLLVSGERPGVLTARLLATRPMRWFGRISYSLYLWHWPILIIGPQLLERGDLATRLALAGLSVAVAAASTRFIETPFRTGRAARARSAPTLAAAGALSLLVAAGAVLGSGQLIGHRPAGPDPDRPLVPLLAGPLPADMRARLPDVRDDLPRTRQDRCQPPPTEARPPDCVFGVTDGPVTVALMGDSHAGQWLPAIEALAAERGWRILPMVKGNCPVVDVTVWHERLQRVYHECDQFRELAIEKLQREGAAIVFIGMTRTYEVVDEDGGRQPIDAIADDWRDGMARALRGIDAVAGRVVLLADTPRHAESPVRCLSRESLVEHCQMERSALVDDEYAAVEAAAARQAGVELVAVDDWLCDTSRCPLVVGDYFVYRDTNHLTASYVADVLAPRLAAVLDGASPAP